MVNVKQMRSNMPRDIKASRKPAPDANWKTLAKQNGHKPASEPSAEPEPVAVEATPFHLTITLMLPDGNPAPYMAMQGAVPVAPPGQQAKLEVRLDARQLIAWLEQRLGPSVNVNAPRIWKPGDPNPPLIRH